jgi:hypothetical protein
MACAGAGFWHCGAFSVAIPGPLAGTTRYRLLQTGIILNNIE